MIFGRGAQSGYAENNGGSFPWAASFLRGIFFVGFLQGPSREKMPFSLQTYNFDLEMSGVHGMGVDFYARDTYALKPMSLHSLLALARPRTLQT